MEVGAHCGFHTERTHSKGKKLLSARFARWHAALSLVGVGIGIICTRAQLGQTRVSLVARQ
jgi:hypothetical protein